MQVKQESAYINTLINPQTDTIKSENEQVWGGDVRNIDRADVCRVGDSFTIPMKPVICTTKIGENVVEFCIVDLTKASGEVVPMRFFPNMLAKSVIARNPDFSAIGRVKTSGTAADLFQTFVGQDGSMQKAMEALYGKTIKVTSEQEVKMFPFGAKLEELQRGEKQLQTTRIFVYDLA